MLQKRCLSFTWWTHRIFQHVVLPLCSLAWIVRPGAEKQLSCQYAICTMDTQQRPFADWRKQWHSTKDQWTGNSQWYEMDYGIHAPWTQLSISNSSFVYQCQLSRSQVHNTSEANVADTKQFYYEMMTRMHLSTCACSLLWTWITLDYRDLTELTDHERLPWLNWTDRPWEEWWMERR